MGGSTLMVWYYVITIGGLFVMSGVLMAIFDGIGIADALNIFYTTQNNVMSDYYQNSLYPDQARRWAAMSHNMLGNHIKTGVISLLVSIGIGKLVVWLSQKVVSSPVATSPLWYIIVQWCLLGIVVIVTLIALSKIIFRQRIDAFQQSKSHLGYHGMDGGIDNHAQNILQIYGGMAQIIYMLVVFWLII